MPVVGPPPRFHGIAGIQWYAAPNVAEDGRSCMGYREVSVVQVREILRLWVRGRAVRAIGRATQTDRKTVGRYIAAAEALGLTTDQGEEAITEEVIAQVVEAVRPARAFGRGRAWQALERERAFLKERVDKGLRLTKIHELLERRGIAVPYRTLHRFCAIELGYGRRRPPSPSPTAIPGRNSRSTSDGWGWSLTRPRDDPGCATPWCSPRCTAATCSFTSPSPRPFKR